VVCENVKTNSKMVEREKVVFEGNMVFDMICVTWRERVCLKRVAV